MCVCGFFSPWAEFSITWKGVLGLWESWEWSREEITYHALVLLVLFSQEVFQLQAFVGCWWDGCLLFLHLLGCILTERIWTEVHYLFWYLFILSVPDLGSTRDLWSSLWHADLSVAACRILVTTWELLVEACGILFLDQGLNPLHWQHRVLATAPPGNSQGAVCVVSKHDGKKGKEIQELITTFICFL